MAKRFFAEHGIPFTEKDVTVDPKAMEELKAVAGRFITPTLVIDGQLFIGFGMNLGPIREALRRGGYLERK